MESAALFFIALSTHLSGMGVMFGWQPMPEGDSNETESKVEYIVQIEPELAATLKAGHSIPITSDIPDNIGPIGRIRIVVGRDDLPKQNLVTNFKPWPQNKSTDRLVETQFTVPPVQSNGSGRYANQVTQSNANQVTQSNANQVTQSNANQATTSNAILPPGSNNSTSNQLGRALQQGARQAQDLATDTKNQILPPASQIFGQGGASDQGVQNSIDSTTNQLRQGLQRGVEQVADRTGQQLRQAVDNVGRGASDAVDKFGRSLGSEPLGQERSILNSIQNQNSNTILPPGSQPTSGLGATKGRRIDQPIQPRQPQPQQPLAPPANFAESSSGGNNPASQPGIFNAPWPPINNNPPPATTVNDTPPPSRYGNQNGQQSTTNSQWPNKPSGRDAFDLANLPNNSAPPRYPSTRQPELDTASNRTEGPQFPGMGNQTASQQATDNPWPNQRTKLSQQTSPEIRRDMLNQPVNNAVQTASNAQGYQEQTTARPPLDAQPRDFGWNQNNLDTVVDHSGSNSNKSLFPLLLSWVLLSGSGAGNLYLFWSYLDVRSKYQGIVHGYSGRRDRYED